MDFDEIDRQFKKLARLVLLECAFCQSTTEVRMESARTSYPFDGKLGSCDDPNRDVPLCRLCAKDHHAYWDDMWNEYYESLR
jgi:hypothetical protein